jgi:hypothetical protein
MKEQSEMTTKIILVVVAITTAMMLSSMAGAVPTQYVHAAKEKCTTYELEGTGETQSVCVEQGKDPTVSFEFCNPDVGCFGDEFETTHRQGAEVKNNEQQFCKQVVNDNDDDGVTCSK